MEKDHAPDALVDGVVHGEEDFPELPAVFLSVLHLDPLQAVSHGAYKVDGPKQLEGQARALLPASSTLAQKPSAGHQDSVLFRSSKLLSPLLAP